jgi:hypothetical protein
VRSTSVVLARVCLQTVACSGPTYACRVPGVQQPQSTRACPRLCTKLGECLPHSQCILPSMRYCLQYATTRDGLCLWLLQKVPPSDSSRMVPGCRHATWLRRTLTFADGPCVDPKYTYTSTRTANTISNATSPRRLATDSLRHEVHAKQGCYGPTAQVACMASHVCIQHSSQRRLKRSSLCDQTSKARLHALVQRHSRWAMHKLYGPQA